MFRKGIVLALIVVPRWCSIEGSEHTQWLMSKTKIKKYKIKEIISNGLTVWYAITVIFYSMIKAGPKARDVKSPLTAQGTPHSAAE